MFTDISNTTNINIISLTTCNTASTVSVPITIAINNTMYMCMPRDTCSEAII